MTERPSDQGDQIWQRVRRAVLTVIHDVLGPPPPDVWLKIDDIIREAKHDWEQETDRCQDEADQPADGTP